MAGKNNYVMRRLDAKKGDSYQRLIFLCYISKSAKVSAPACYDEKKI